MIQRKNYKTNSWLDLSRSYEIYLQSSDLNPGLEALTPKGMCLIFLYMYQLELEMFLYSIICLGSYSPFEEIIGLCYIDSLAPLINIICCCALVNVLDLVLVIIRVNYIIWHLSNYTAHQWSKIRNISKQAYMVYKLRLNIITAEVYK